MLWQSLWKRTFDSAGNAQLLKFYTEEIYVHVCFYDLHEAYIDLICHGGYLYRKMPFNNKDKPLGSPQSISPV